MPYYLTTNVFGKPQHVLPSGDIQEEFFGYESLQAALPAINRRLERVIEHAGLNGGLEPLTWDTIESLTVHLSDGNGGPVIPFVHPKAYLPRYEYLLRNGANGQGSGTH